MSWRLDALIEAKRRVTLYDLIEATRQKREAQVREREEAEQRRREARHQRFRARLDSVRMSRDGEAARKLIIEHGAGHETATREYLAGRSHTYLFTRLHVIEVQTREFAAYDRRHR